MTGLKFIYHHLLYKRMPSSIYFLAVLCLLPVIHILGLLTLICMGLQSFNPFSILLALIIFLLFAATIRRAHDFAKPAIIGAIPTFFVLLQWLLFAIPDLHFILSIVKFWPGPAFWLSTIIILAIPGSRGPNKYGPEPKPAHAQKAEEALEDFTQLQKAIKSAKQYRKNTDQRNRHDN